MNKLTAKLLRCNYSMYLDSNGNYIPYNSRFDRGYRYVVSGNMIHSLYPTFATSNDSLIVTRNYQYDELSDLHRYVTTGKTTPTPKPSPKHYSILDMLKKLILKMKGY